jgi:hypothetical protein
MTLTIDVPTSVWLDALDPLASGMQAELGLPEPQRIKRGRGSTERYVDVTPDQALEVASYIEGRADMLLSQGMSDPHDRDEKAQRDCYRLAIKCAERIRYQVAA